MNNNTVKAIHSNDEAIGKAIREFIEQDTGASESVHLRLELIKDVSSFAWHKELDNKVCLYIDINKTSDQEPSHISVHGDNLYTALIVAGLLNGEEK